MQNWCLLGCDQFEINFQVVNTTSDDISDVAIEASVWDLEGTCPYYNIHEKLSMPPKRTVAITEINYPKSENPKPVYFLLLKLYRMSDYGILSRNFYWLYLPGGDYSLLEPYRMKKIPLKITSKVNIQGYSYEVQVEVENTSKKPNLEDQLHKNSFCRGVGHGDCDGALHSFALDSTEDKQEATILQKINKFMFQKSNKNLSMVEINGPDAGVAFFLHFSVHASKENKEGEDTRILPVHYSDNYFSLVPGEIMSITMSFEVSPGITPRIILNGWNHCDNLVVL